MSTMQNIMLTTLWIMLTSTLGYLAGAHFAHPVWGLASGFILGTLLRYIPDITLDVFDIGLELLD